MRGLLSLMLAIPFGATACIIEKHYHDHDDDDEWGDDGSVTTPPSAYGDSDNDAVGDEDSGDNSSSPSAEPTPTDIDVTGDYNVLTAAIMGCEEESFWLEAWAQGPMRISGENDSLTIDFLGGMEFGGVVDSSQNYSFTGEVEFSADGTEDTGWTSRMARLDVENYGTFSLNGNCWEMDGDFTLLVDENNDGLDFNNCTVTGQMKAFQIEGGSCSGVD